jgi:hypothetical protein
MKPLRRIYPQEGTLKFDGGKNSKFERTIILDNESPDCANVVFSNGAVESRQGYGKLNTTAVGSFVCDGLYTRRGNDNAETMVAFFGGSAWQLGGTTFTTIGSAQSVFTAGVRMASAMQENYSFYGNGGTIPYKYNGIAFTRHGVYPPTTTSTVASNAAGVLNGDYRYKVTFVNTALVESDVGPVTATFAAANATLRITSVPVAPQSWGVGHRRLYRNKTSASGTYFRVTTISDNSTTTYDDNAADSTLGAEAPTDNGVPPKYNAVIYHQSRLFMNDTANPNYVWWTNLNDPYTVAAASNFKQIGDNTSDLVKGFAVFDNSLIVFCEKSITIAYMPSTDPTEWVWVTSRSAHGSKSPFCLIPYNNKLLFPAVQNGKFTGFSSFNGDTVDTSATLLTVSTAGSESTSERIEPDMFSVVESTLGNISGIVYKNRAFISLTYSSGTTNNRVYCFDFSASNLSKSQEASWVPWTGIQAAQFTVYNGFLYFGSANAVGYVYRLENGTYNDDGAAIDSYYWTKEFGGYKEDRSFFKDYRFLNMLVENVGAYYMNLTVRIDSDNGSGDTQQVYLSPGGSLWGTMIWGADSWGGGSSQEEKELFISPYKGKRIQFKFSNQNVADQRFKVHGMNYAYNLKGFR